VKEEEKEPSLLSFKGGREGAVSEMSLLGIYQIGIPAT
jgi:hypothetical protein